MTVARAGAKTGQPSALRHFITGQLTCGFLLASSTRVRIHASARCWAFSRRCSTPRAGDIPMRDTDSRPPLRELPARFSLPLIGDTLAFVRDPAGFLQKRAREVGPVFRIDVFGAPTACFVGPEAFALVLDDKNVARAAANPPHVEELFNPEAVPFLDGEKQRRRKRPAN